MDPIVPMAGVGQAPRPGCRVSVGRARVVAVGFGPSGPVLLRTTRASHLPRVCLACVFAWEREFGSGSAKVAQERTRPGGDANTHDLARWPGRLDEIRRFGTGRGRQPRPPRG
jgi:hypothetical protein